MPRFIGKPVIVEAFQFEGHTHTMPESFRLAVRAHRVGGIIEVMTGDGVRACRHGDWLVHGPDGTFSVQRGALFETWFEAFQPTPTITDELPASPAKRQPRKESVHG